MYESVCDCCLQTFRSSSLYLDRRDCPSCGVGKLLGPWPRTPRFPHSLFDDLKFRRLTPEEATERE
ncbi:MAG: hypothetical protein ACJ76Z_08540 [Thermoleophilaceae bacterium]